ncbi:MAG: hypothetical protein PVJ39_08780 [Gammaproteobacteria bacterium]|jgi:hypothetical protein
MNTATAQQPAPLPSTAPSFADLASRCLWGICLNLKEHVITTHRELALLRRCAKLALEQPGQVIHVVSPQHTGHANYIVKTLMHFGVSCGQICVSPASRGDLAPGGVWLLVGNRQHD